MSVEKIVIFGTAAFAEVMHYYFSNDDRYEVVAFTVHQENINAAAFLGLPVVAFEKIETVYNPTEFKMFIAVGYTQMNRVRATIYHASKSKGYELVTYISPHCTYLGESIGDNCVIMEDNTIQPFVKIGNNVVLWSGNHIGHHSRIQDHCFITSHVVVSGYVDVGELSFIGVNATIRDSVKIGSSSQIGAGSIIMGSTKPESVYVPERTRPRKIVRPKGGAVTQ